MLKVEAHEPFQEAIYKCVNDLGFPSSTVEKPILHMMMETAISLGHHLLSHDVTLRNKAIMEMQIQL